MVLCCVIGCSNRTDRNKLKKDEMKLSFHMFPKNVQLRNKWIKAVGRHNWLPSDVAVVCSNHFTKSCFYHTLSVVRLKPGSVPTIFPERPVYLDQYMSMKPLENSNNTVSQYTEMQRNAHFQNIETQSFTLSDINAQADEPFTPNHAEAILSKCWPGVKKYEPRTESQNMTKIPQMEQMKKKLEEKMKKNMPQKKTMKNTQNYEIKF